MKNDFNKKNLSNYSISKLWKKISTIARKFSKTSLRYVLLLYYALRSDKVSLGNKAIILGALGYYILPLDLIPDVLPILGLIDDAAAFKLTYDAVKVSITPDIESKTVDKLTRWFREK